VRLDTLIVGLKCLLQASHRNGLPEQTEPAKLVRERLLVTPSVPDCDTELTISAWPRLMVVTSPILARSPRYSPAKHRIAR
jgi:hypothetical protein